MPNAARIALLAVLLLALPARASADEPRGAPASAMGAPASAMYGELSASSMLVVGLMPVAGFGLASALTLRWTSISVLLEQRAIEAFTSHEVQSAGKRSRAWLGAASACYHRDTVFMCSIVQTGPLEMPIPEDAKLAGAPSHWIATAGGRGGADWCVSRRVCIRGFLELHVIPVRPVLSLGSLTLMQTSSFAALAGLGVTLAVGQQ
ncbi:hypothetical protein [Sorangium sp. So ce1024]|uniref:hypothetical protein n=1 Tax=Sorangium sp. So ce1024 TaxID=3133327 RepID=UPI003F091A02